LSQLFGKHCRLRHKSRSPSLEQHYLSTPSAPPTSTIECALIVTRESASCVNIPSSMSQPITSSCPQANEHFLKHRPFICHLQGLEARPQVAGIPPTSHLEVLHLLLLRSLAVWKLLRAIRYDSVNAPSLRRGPGHTAPQIRIRQEKHFRLQVESESRLRGKRCCTLWSSFGRCHNVPDGRALADATAFKMKMSMTVEWRHGTKFVVILDRRRAQHFYNSAGPEECTPPTLL
jgi:hypothetical protein